MSTIESSTGEAAPIMPANIDQSGTSGSWSSETSGSSSSSSWSSSSTSTSSSSSSSSTWQMIDGEWVQVDGSSSSNSNTNTDSSSGGATSENVETSENTTEIDTTTGGYVPFDHAEIDYTQVWSEVQIREWVSANFGVDSWSTVRDTHLVSAETSEAYALKIVEGLVNTWQVQISGMPPVCDATCREEVWANLMNDLREDWKNLMDGINLGFETAKNDTRALIEQAYWAADACDPDCKCENIMIEYDSVTKVQDELSATIVDLLDTYANLELHQTDILDVCPSYREVDGDIFYDF